MNHRMNHCYLIHCQYIQHIPSEYHGKAHVHVVGVIDTELIACILRRPTLDVRMWTSALKVHDAVSGGAGAFWFEGDPL